MHDEDCSSVCTSGWFDNFDHTSVSSGQRQCWSELDQNCTV